MPRKTLALVFAAPLLAAGFADALDQGFDWPRWRGPEANGISRESGWNPRALSGGPRVLWQTDIGRGYSNVAIKDQRVYSLGSFENCNMVQCLDACTGNKIWKFAFESSEDPQSTPTIDGEAVYVLSKEGILICLDALRGTLVWKRDVTSDFGAMEPYYGFAGSPVIEKGWVILTANVSGLALKKSTGELAWNSRQVPIVYPTWTDRPAGTDYSTPVVFSFRRERYVLISSSAGLHAVHVATGRLLWVYGWAQYCGGLTADPLLAGQRIFVDCESKAGGPPASVLLDAAYQRPRVLWRSPDLATDMTNPVIIDGYIYGCNGGPSLSASPASLRCLELETGRLMWQDTLGEPPRKGVFSLMAAGGKLIVLSDKGRLFIAEASPAGFRPVSSADVFRGRNAARRFYTPPVLCNGRIYCRNYAGELICIDVRK